MKGYTVRCTMENEKGCMFAEVRYGGFKTANTLSFQNGCLLKVGNLRRYVNKGNEQKTDFVRLTPIYRKKR